MTPARATIVGLGDSTTAGTPGFRSPVEAPPDGAGDPRSQYGFWMVQGHPEWRFLNRGVNGERSDQVVRRVPRDLVAERPHLVIVLAGVVDLFQGRPSGPVRQNLEAIYGAARTEGIQVVAATVLPYDGMSGSARAARREVNEWVRDRARELDLGFCDTARFAASEDDPDRLRGTPDGLHPDVDGYRRVGEGLRGVVARRLALTTGVPGGDAERGLGSRR